MRSKSCNEASSYSLSLRSASEKSSETTDKAAASQCSVTSTYHIWVAGAICSAAVTWSKSIINHSLTVSIEKPTDNSIAYTFKVELKPWPFWSKKGFKTLDVGGRRIDVFWDFRSTKFGNGPEPFSGFYVALVCHEEIILLLGDHLKEAYKRTKCKSSTCSSSSSSSPAASSSSSTGGAVLASRRENVFGKKCFTTRARFELKKREHEIVVENSIAGPKEPEMWITIDGTVAVHVTNLHWKFRGNQTALVDKAPVQVFWDVHDWLFTTPGTGHALFIFKPGSSSSSSQPGSSSSRREEEEEEEDDDGGDDVHDNDVDDNDSSLHAKEKHRSNSSHNQEDDRHCTSQSPEFCFFLYAWKLE
ncbi:hypothetical protein ZOSMA_195G00140 [Zostera marina]|uniref:DUF868 family protein n=1 Tax=Zostera marina TaxID=29655 RepID=A0A0K9PNS1_ZOSMR|nr:hypothetical protein ZOSMA_195G00140 [Zostera marina]